MNQSSTEPAKENNRPRAAYTASSALQAAVNRLPITLLHSLYRFDDVFFQTVAEIRKKSRVVIGMTYGMIIDADADFPDSELTAHMILRFAYSETSICQWLALSRMGMIR